MTRLRNGLQIIHFTGRDACILAALEGEQHLIVKQLLQPVVQMLQTLRG